MKCFECKTELEYTGRNTPYCPECDVCEECGCPRADNFEHYAGCKMAEVHDEDNDRWMENNR